MRINNNMAALNTWRSLTASGDNLQKSLERLSSGYRINRAADDAAGLAVSEKMRSQIRGVNMATRNAQDGVSMVQTAEGGASKIQDMLQRMRELAVQASSDTLGSSDRDKLDLEFKELAKEINRTAMATKFNGQNLITGNVTAGGTVTTLSNGSVTAQNSFAGVTVTGNNTQWGGTGLGAGNYRVVIKDDGGTPGNHQFQLQKDDGTGFNDVAGAITTSSAAATTTAAQFGATGITLDVTTAGTLTDGTVVGTFAVTSNSVTTPDHGDTSASAFNVAVGANAGETISVSFDSLNGESLGITGTGGVDTLATGGTNGNVDIVNNASNTIKTLDSALDKVSSARAKMGAYQNRLDNAVSTLQIQSENLTAAESRIRDVDMAAEMAEFTKYQVLQQAGTAMLAQANQLPQGIMSLLR